MLKRANYESAMIGKFHLSGPANNPYGDRAPTALGWDYFYGYMEAAPPSIDTTAGGVAEAGKRLPTEAEWEFAARGGLDGKTYVWGDEAMPGGKHMANTFQGHFPDRNEAKDGFPKTAPVCSFPVNGYGLCDMSGNVWQWTADWYRSDYYRTLASQGGLARNPHGPVDSYDQSEPGVQKRVQKGGSFLCSDQYCSRYRPGGRGKGDPSTGASNAGFRLVQN